MSTLVVRNTSLLTMSSVLQKLISFGYFTIIARLIGVGNTGQYFFAISFTTIFTVVADFGLGSVLTREGARNPGRLSEYVSAIFSAKLILGVLAYGGVLVASYMLQYSTDLRMLIAISGATMFFDNLQTAFYSAFRAKQNLVYEAGGNIAAQAVTLIIGTVSLVLHAPLYWLILAYTIPSALVCVYAYAMLKKVYGVSVTFLADKSILKPIFIIALPFAAASIVGRLYSYADLVIMSKLLSAHDIGLWSAPYKIVFAFQFIPAALSASLYPAFSAMFMGSKEGITELYIKSIRYLAMFSVPLATGLFVLADPIILFLFGPKYEGSGTILMYLSVSLLATYTSLITGALLNATNRQKLQTFLMVVALVMNVAMNVVLIPKYGIYGAAIAASTTGVVLMLGGFLAVQSVLGANFVKFVAQFFRFIIPAAVMAVAVFVLQSRTHVVVNIFVGALVYTGIAILFKVVDVKEMYTMLTRKTV